jgi:hypothetical protein
LLVELAVAVEGGDDGGPGRVAGAHDHAAYIPVVGGHVVAVVEEGGESGDQAHDPDVGVERVQRGFAAGDGTPVGPQLVGDGGVDG